MFVGKEVAEVCVGHDHIIVFVGRFHFDESDFLFFFPSFVAEEERSHLVVGEVD